MYSQKWTGNLDGVIYILFEHRISQGILEFPVWKRLGQSETLVQNLLHFCIFCISNVLINLCCGAQPHDYHCFYEIDHQLILNLENGVENLYKQRFLPRQSLCIPSALVILRIGYIHSRVTR